MYLYPCAFVANPLEGFDLASFSPSQFILFYLFWGGGGVGRRLLGGFQNFSLLHDGNYGHDENHEGLIQTKHKHLPRY